MTAVLYGRIALFASAIVLLDYLGRRHPRKTRGASVQPRLSTHLGSGRSYSRTSAT